MLSCPSLLRSQCVQPTEIIIRRRRWGVGGSKDGRAGAAGSATRRRDRRGRRRPGSGVSRPRPGEEGGGRGGGGRGGGGGGAAPDGQSADRPGCAASRSRSAATRRRRRRRCRCCRTQSACVSGDWLPAAGPTGTHAGATKADPIPISGLCTSTRSPPPPPPSPPPPPPPPGCCRTHRCTWRRATAGERWWRCCLSPALTWHSRPCGTQASGHFMPRPSTATSEWPRA